MKVRLYCGYGWQTTVSFDSLSGRRCRGHVDLLQVGRWTMTSESVEDTRGRMVQVRFAARPLKRLIDDY